MKVFVQPWTKLSRRLELGEQEGGYSLHSRRKDLEAFLKRDREDLLIEGSEVILPTGEPFKATVTRDVARQIRQDPLGRHFVTVDFRRI